MERVEAFGMPYITDNFGWQAAGRVIDACNQYTAFVGAITDHIVFSGEASQAR
jgi:hypothetical protein